MKKQLPLSILLYSSLVYADNLSDAFKNSTIDGELRVVNYTRSATDSDIFPKAAGTAVGTQLGVTTGAIDNVKINAKFFSTNAITSDTDLESTNLVNGTEDYAILGIANVEYNDKINILKIGRQELSTPLVASDDARVVKDLFTAINFSTKVIPQTTIHTLYIDKNSGMDNGSDKSKFVSMSKTLGTNYDRGMLALGIENNSIKNTKLSAWYYNGIDFIPNYAIAKS